MRYLGPVAVCVLLAALFAGCTAAPSAPPSSVPSAMPSTLPSALPSNDPADPLAAVTAIVVRPEKLDLNDANGATVRTLSYDAEASEFVAVMSSLFGADPAVQDKAADPSAFDETDPTDGSEALAMTQYLWNGLLLWDAPTADGVQDMNLVVIFHAPTIGEGISVATIQGFKPGDDLSRFTGDPEIGRFPLEKGDRYSVGGMAGPSTSMIFAPWITGLD